MSKFKIGDRVRKTSGSNWEGVVVGTYSTTLTPEGYAVESDTEKGSVQIYPAKALEFAPPKREWQEPVAFRKWLKRMEWSDWFYDRFGDNKPHCPDCGNQKEDGHVESCELAALLNTTPPKLTDEEIDMLLLLFGLMDQWPTQKQVHAFTRAIEAKLKEKNFIS